MTFDPEIQKLLDEANEQPEAEAEAEPSISEPINYDRYREDSFASLDEIWNHRLSLPENFMRLAEQSVILPYANIQLPIITAYAFIPSALASIVPLLFFQGDKGCGKSNLTTLISALHDSKVISAATTFAALRNYYNQIRWRVPGICRHERNCCLLFDNINKDTLSDEKLYSMLLSGYNRKTDNMSISKGDGTNLDFKVFGLKVMSSIHPLYAQPRFAELNRRCIVIKCKPFEKMNAEEKASLHLPKDFQIMNRLELDGIDLSSLNARFTSFWENDFNCSAYVNLRKQLVSKRSKLKLPEVFDGAKWTISIDLVIAGTVVKIWDSVESAIEAVGNYWEWHKYHIASSYSATHKLLKDFITDELSTTIKTNQELGYEAIESEIRPDKLKKHLAWASTQGMLDLSPTPSVITEIMHDLGWRLDRGKHGQICWVPSTR